MKKLTTEADFKEIKVGERVMKVAKGDYRTLTLVGKMPQTQNYLIFCEGEHLEHLHIPSIVKGTKRTEEWYSGEYDEHFIGERMIEYHKNQIKAIEQVYLGKEKQ